MFKLLSSPQDARLYLRLLGYVRPYRALLLVSLLAMLVLAAADAAKAALLKPMLDGAFIDGDPELMVSIPLYLIALFVLSGLAAFVSGSSLHWVANKVVMDIKNEMFARVLSLPARFFDGESAGAIVSRFTYDAGQIKEATTSAVTVMVKDTLVIAGLLLWMVYLDWRMTLITLLGGPFILMIALFIRRRLRDMSRKVQETMADLNRIVNESIKAGRIIRLHGGQEFEKERFLKTVNANRRYTMKFVNAAVASGPAVQLIAALALAVIIYYAAGQAAQDLLQQLPPQVEVELGQRVPMALESSGDHLQALTASRLHNDEIEQDDAVWDPRVDDIFRLSQSDDAADNENSSGEGREVGFHDETTPGYAACCLRDHGCVAGVGEGLDE